MGLKGLELSCSHLAPLGVRDEGAPPGLRWSLPGAASSEQPQPSIRACALAQGSWTVSSPNTGTLCLLPRPVPSPVPLLTCPAQARLQHAVFCPQIFQAYLAFQDLRNDAPVPYNRSLDEGGMVLTTLPSPSATSSVNMPTTGPNSLSYASSALSPCLTAPKVPRLAMMPDN